MFFKLGRIICAYILACLQKINLGYISKCGCLSLKILNINILKALVFREYSYQFNFLSIVYESMSILLTLDNIIIEDKKQCCITLSFYY